MDEMSCSASADYTEPWYNLNDGIHSGSPWRLNAEHDTPMTPTAQTRLYSLTLSHSSPPCSPPPCSTASPCSVSKRSQSTYCMYSSSSSGSAVAHSAAPSAVPSGSTASAPAVGASRPASRASLKSVPAASSYPASIALAGSHAASSFSQQCTMPGLVLLLGVCAPTGGGRDGELARCARISYWRGPKG